MTRFEALVVAGVVGLLAAVVVPGVANTAARYNRLACLSNLRQMGVAFRTWGNDHGDFVPLRTPMKNGGLGQNVPGSGSPYPRAGDTWYNFMHLSNQISSPKILVCPSDTAKVQSSTWAEVFAIKNLAVSYFVGTEVFPTAPQAIVAGDRNLQADGIGNCDAGIKGTWQSLADSRSRSGWTNIMHFPMGNLLLNDGQVVETTTDRMHWYLGLATHSGAVHMVMP